MELSYRGGIFSWSYHFIMELSFYHGVISSWSYLINLINNLFNLVLSDILSDILFYLISVISSIFSWSYLIMELIPPRNGTKKAYKWTRERSQMDLSKLTNGPEKAHKWTWESSQIDPRKLTFFAWLHVIGMFSKPVSQVSFEILFSSSGF